MPHRDFKPRAAPAVIPGLGVDVPELRQARALWQANRFDDALQLFEAATRQYPQNLVALIDASRALGARFEIKRAEALLDKLAKLGGRSPEALHLAGQSYRMIFRQDKAMECFRRVVAVTRAIPDAQLELAVLYERRHRIEEARALIEDCIRASPDYLEAQLFKARLQRRMHEEGAAEELLRRLAASEAAHPLVRAQAWAEWAHMLDKRGDYDAAMAAMLESKKPLREMEGPFRRESDAVVRQLGEIAAAVTRRDFERWAEEGRSLPPAKTAALASFPRSGTTLLEQALDSHPGLVSSDEREAFARDIFPAMWRTAQTRLPSVTALDAMPRARLLAQRTRYLDYMAAALNEPLGDRIHLDKNPTLTLLLPALLRLFPETKILIALRDPRDVVISCFMQYLALNTNSVCFLTLERTAERYRHDMLAWRELREKIPASWRETRYENCVANMAGETRSALEFLGLPWDPQVLEYRERLKTKAVSSPTYEAVSQPIYATAVGRWKHYEKYFGPTLDILAPLVEALGY
ncbi:MAG TPA: sulfotransferase [Verrucomicrobiae bacterium]|jgi:Tfp pilus assembly protein PilF|nr:sulfotransferase [Verrucomicrobiae bacterium]